MFLPQAKAERLLDKALRSGKVCRVKWYTKDGKLADRNVRLWSKKAITFYPRVMDNPCSHIPWLYTALDTKKAAMYGDVNGWVNITTDRVIEIKQKGLLERLLGL